ncbi:MAG: amidase [Candidatus Rokubacteria bacterium]|nr:amidase [Candidatus Rokubacteria bacterium]
MQNDELCYMSATELAEAIRTRTLSPLDVTKAILARIEQVNPKVNAYCTVVAEAALAEARHAEAAVMQGRALGPLHGVPISFKDLTPTAGIRTTFGSKIFEHHVPQEDAPVVERARRAGAILLGKTNTPEFGCKGVTDNLIFGHTRNPWMLDRIAGGSSGGAAAALAAGLGPLAEGSDLGGSIRIPASCCGVVGLKPSVGRVPRYPSPNAWTVFSVLGPMARTVRDAALLLSVMVGPDDRDPQSLPATGEEFARAAEGEIRGLRLAWSPDLGYAAVDGEVKQLCEAAAKTFATLGCSVEEAHPGFEDPEPIFLDLTAPVRAAALRSYLAEWQDQMDPILVERIAHADRLTAVEYEKAVHRRTAFWQIVRRFFERHDLLLTPTIATPPRPLESPPPTEIGGRHVDSPMARIAFTYPFNLTAQPAMSVPCGWTADGLPVGLQIVGRRFAEATVLRAAAAFEAASPWAHRRAQL